MIDSCDRFLLCTLFSHMLIQSPLSVKTYGHNNESVCIHILIKVIQLNVLVLIVIYHNVSIVINIESTKADVKGLSPSSVHL